MLPWDMLATFGVPTLLLAALGWALFQGVKSVGAWIAPRADQIVKAHTSFIENTDAALQRLTKNYETMDGRLANLESVSARQTDILSRLSCHQNSKPRNDA